MNPLTQFQKTTFLPLLIPLVFVCFWLSPAAQAVVPAPDGGYPGNNTAEGTSALFSLTSGIDNTALGFQALFKNTTGNFNTAEGYRALFNNTDGIQNTATGVNALIGNTTGSYNTANGVNTLNRNTTGSYNTATGVQALFSNTTGVGNTANGVQSLFNNTTGIFNTANGSGALFSNTTGCCNVATGAYALPFNTTGSYNTADGIGALNDNTTGANNTATGFRALQNNTTGNGNTATGYQALLSNTTGNGNTALGFDAGFNLTTGDNNIDIGNEGVAGESDTTRIGNTQTKTFVAGISGVAVTGTAVVVDGNGQLGVAPSSQRFKDEIKPMDNASEALFSFKPVAFHYKKEIDSAGRSHFGLVAEDVEKVNPDLVVRDKEGKPYTVRYDQVNAMLLNEFLKEHRTVEELKKEIAALTATVKEQAAQIQKVSAQLEANKPAPQVVNNP